MHWTLLIKSCPDAPGNPVLHALRFAACALADEVSISIFLLQEGLAATFVESPEGAPPPSTHHDLLDEIRELGGEIYALGLEWLEPRAEKKLAAGIHPANMATLIRTMKNSDQVISF